MEQMTPVGRLKQIMDVSKAMSKILDESDVEHKDNMSTQLRANILVLNHHIEQMSAELSAKHNHPIKTGDTTMAKLTEQEEKYLSENTPARDIESIDRIVRLSRALVAICNDIETSEEVKDTVLWAVTTNLEHMSKIVDGAQHYQQLLQKQAKEA
ncbi:hypothetical protein [Desulfocastanea catecholica]